MPTAYDKASSELTTSFCPRVFTSVMPGHDGGFLVDISRQPYADGRNDFPCNQMPLKWPELLSVLDRMGPGAMKILHANARGVATSIAFQDPGTRIDFEPPFPLAHPEVVASALHPVGSRPVAIGISGLDETGFYARTTILSRTRPGASDPLPSIVYLATARNLTETALLAGTSNILFKAPESWQSVWMNYADCSGFPLSVQMTQTEKEIPRGGWYSATVPHGKAPLSVQFASMPDITNPAASLAPSMNDDAHCCHSSDPFSSYLCCSYKLTQGPGVYAIRKSRVITKSLKPPGCMHNCSGHGMCNMTTLQCTCDEGYTGCDCGRRWSSPTPVWSMSKGRVRYHRILLAGSLVSLSGDGAYCRGPTLDKSSCRVSASPDVQVEVRIGGAQITMSRESRCQSSARRYTGHLSLKALCGHTMTRERWSIHCTVQDFDPENRQAHDVEQSATVLLAYGESSRGALYLVATSPHKRSVQSSKTGAICAGMADAQRRTRAGAVTVVPVGSGLHRSLHQLLAWLRWVQVHSLQASSSQTMERQTCSGHGFCKGFGNVSAPDAPKCKCQHPWFGQSCSECSYCGGKSRGSCQGMGNPHAANTRLKG